MNQTISLRILSFIALGFSINEAMDTVLGAGSYQRIAGETYDALRS